MKILKTLGFGVAVAAMAVASGTASAQSQSSARKAQTKSMQEIPVCQKRLGTVSIVEPDTNWWQQLGLGSPEAIIKLFVMKSGCFGLVEDYSERREGGSAEFALVPSVNALLHLLRRFGCTEARVLPARETDHEQFRRGARVIIHGIKG